jgi:two-component system, response regulator PdtaR
MCLNHTRNMELKTHEPSILVVEDEPLILLGIAEEFRTSGFIVYEALNADVALQELSNHQDIAVLFTDIDIPGSMNGLSLSLMVQQERPSMKIVVTSGMQVPEEECMPKGGLFFPKPYLASDIVAAVRAFSA